jgi:hypothetical protein
MQVFLMINLEAVITRHRAAIDAVHQLPAQVQEDHAPALKESAVDILHLIREVDDLRGALAARFLSGEQMTLREAIRVELIYAGAEAEAQVDAVRALHAPVEQGRVYCGYRGSDRPDCPSCYHPDGTLGSGHTRTVCSHCHDDRPRHFKIADEPYWPCATIKILDQESAR